MSADGGADAIDELLAAAVHGQRRAVGRLLSLVERGGHAAERIEELTHARSGGAHVVGITGAPGAGKSTLTGALVRAVAASGASAAVLAIDPSSPVTGGAILGDRIRMDDVVDEVRDRVFIRSMATRGQRGGLALAVPAAVRVLEACGVDLVVVETVGVGQVEIDIVGEADTTVVVVNPGWGDAIQANKAGLLELADALVVNKADRPGADDTVRDLEHMLDLGHAGSNGGWRPPVVRTIATRDEGTMAVLDRLDAHRRHLEDTGELAKRRGARLANEVRARARRSLEDALDLALRDAADLAVEVTERRTTPSEAARSVVGRLVVIRKG